MQLRFQWRPFIHQSLAMALFLYVQWVTNIWTTKVVRPRTLDDTVLPVLGFAAINLAIMLAGDRLARRWGRSDRMTYCLIALLAGSVMHAVALAPSAYESAIVRGDATLLILIPALLGASTGYLLHKSLGYSLEGDEPQTLADAIGDFKEVAGRAFASTESAEYYAGPLQVRDSSMAAFIAALIGSTLFVFIQAIAEVNQPFLTTIVRQDAFGGPAAMFLSGIIGITLPMYIFVRKAQGFLQARGKFELGSYIKAGAVVPGLIFLGLLALMGPFALMVVLPWILPSMAAMGAYHRLAGYEPLALSDDIEVSDRRTLIAANHPRRQMHRIVGRSAVDKPGNAAAAQGSTN